MNRAVRDEQVASLLGFVQENQAVGVVGEPGIGKSTRLMQAISTIPHVLGQSLPSLATIAYAPLSHALQHWLTGSPDDVVAEVVPHLGLRLLVLEDVQWADPQTIEVLSGLVGRVRIVLSCRDRSSLPVVPGLAVFEIQPLSPRAAQALARRLHPELDEQRRRQLVAAAAGNPLLLNALVAGMDVSPTLAGALAARLGNLDQGERDVLGRMALFGRAAPIVIVGTLDDRRSAGLVATTGGLSDFTHPLIADTILALLDDSSRLRLHADLASRADDGDAARHYMAIGDRTAAADCAERAASLVAAPERADLLSLATLARGDAAPHRLRLDTAASLLGASRPLDSDAVAATVHGGRSCDNAEALLYRSQAAWLRGDTAAAAALCSAARAEVATSPTEPIVAIIVVEQAQQLVRTRIGDPALVDMARAALELAETACIHVAKARSVLGLALAHTGCDGWDEHYRAAAEIARAEGDLEQEFAALYWLVSALGLYGPMQSAWEIGEELLVRTQQIGAQRWHNHFLAAYAVHRFGTGTAPDDLVPRVRHLIEQDPMFRNRAQLDLALSVGLTDRGQFDAAADVIAEGRRFIRNDEDRSLLCVAQCELAWATGADEALRTALNDLATCRSGFFGMNAFAESAAIYLGLEQADEQPIPRFRSGLMPNVDVVATEHIGFDHWRTGNPTAAMATFVTASDEWSRRGFPRFAARARLGAGQIARLGRVGGADRHCAVAADMAKQYKLAPILRAVDREHALHAQSSLRAALTPREFEVLDLVADGFTTTTIANRLGLQRSTVESHVVSARRKLGASTRAQVALIVLAGRV